MHLNPFKKIWLFFALVFLLGIIFPRSTAFWYYEDKVYCAWNSEAISIQLSNPDKSLLLCSSYIGALEEVLLKEYQQLVQVDKMVQRGDDVAYRKELYEQKLLLIKKLYEQRMKFLLTIQDFELIMLEKFQLIIADYLAARIDAVNQVYEHLDPFAYGFSKQIQFLDLFHQTILTLQNTTSLDEFVSALKYYLLLDQQRQWK